MDISAPSSPLSPPRVVGDYGYDAEQSVESPEVVASVWQGWMSTICAQPPVHAQQQPLQQQHVQHAQQHAQHGLYQQQQQQQQYPRPLIPMRHNSVGCEGARPARVSASPPRWQPPQVQPLQPHSGQPRTASAAELAGGSAAKRARLFW